MLNSDYNDQNNCVLTTNYCWTNYDTQVENCIWIWGMVQGIHNKEHFHGLKDSTSALGNSIQREDKKKWHICESKAYLFIHIQK